MRFYGRDSLWRQLRDSNTCSVSQSTEWTQLFLEKIAPNSRSLLAIDPDLSNLLGPSCFDWDAILNHLADLFPSTSRFLQDGSTKRHLVIFNPQNSDYMIHFTAEDWQGHGSQENGDLKLKFQVNATTVSREGVSDPSEWEQIDQIVNAILLWLLDASHKLL